MDRTTYDDGITKIIDIIDETGRIRARKVICRGKYDMPEKEYHKVFEGMGMPDPVKGGVTDGEAE